MKEANIDPNWWRAVIAPIAVTSALIVAACISGLPSTTCAALAKTYGSAVIDFGFSALFASTLFLFCMLVSAAADSGQKKNARSCCQYRRDDCRSGHLWIGNYRRHRKLK
jgi:hypothetical protein